MQDFSDEERREILGEVFTDQLKAILEYVKEIPDIKKRLVKIEARLDSIDIKLNMHEADIVYLRKRVA